MRQHPSTVLAVTSMPNHTSAGLQISGTTTQLEQTLSHLRIAPSTESNPTCQYCKEALTEGDQVTLYLYKPAGRSTYSIDQYRCRRHNEDLTALFTLGVRELIVDGRVGECRDHATQQTWPVLISPSVRLRSAQDTTTGRVPPKRVATDQSTATTLNRQPITETGK